MEVQSSIPWSGARWNQDKVGSGQGVGDAALWRQGLKGVDGIPHLWRKVPTESGALLEQPPTRGTNTRKELGVSEKTLEFSIPGLVLLLQILDVSADFQPSLKRLLWSWLPQMKALGRRCANASALKPG